MKHLLDCKSLCPTKLKCTWNTLNRFNMLRLSTIQIWYNSHIQCVVLLWLCFSTFTWITYSYNLIVKYLSSQNLCYIIIKINHVQISISVHCHAHVNDCHLKQYDFNIYIYCFQNKSQKIQMHHLFFQLQDVIFFRKLF